MTPPLASNCSGLQPLRINVLSVWLTCLSSVLNTGTGACDFCCKTVPVCGSPYKRAAHCPVEHAASKDVSERETTVVESRTTSAPMLETWMDRLQHGPILTGFLDVSPFHSANSCPQFPAETLCLNEISAREQCLRKNSCMRRFALILTSRMESCAGPQGRTFQVV